MYKMRGNNKKSLAILVSAALVFGMVPQSQTVAKVKKPKLSATSVIVQVGETKKIKVKYAKGITWKVNSSGKKKISLSKKSKKGATIKGKAVGKAKITAKIKYGKKKVLKKTIKVTVKAKAKSSTPGENTLVTSGAAKQEPGDSATDKPTESVTDKATDSATAIVVPTGTANTTATASVTKTPEPTKATETAKPTATATVKPTAEATKTPAPTELPGYTGVDVDLSDVADKANQPGVTYNEQTGVLNIQDVGSFMYPLKEKVAAGEKIYVTIRGELKGEKGFRSYLTAGVDFALSNIANSVEDGQSGNFQWNFELTNTSTGDATSLMIKGISPSTNIDNVDIKQIRIAYKSESIPTATATPNVTSKPTATGTATSTPGATVTPTAGTGEKVPALSEKNSFESGTGDFVAAGNASVGVGDDGYAGKCLAIEERTSAQDGVSYSIADKVEAGVSYTVQGYVKTASESATLTCKIQTGEGEEQEFVTAQVSGTWSKFRGSFTVPVDFTKLDIIFTMSDTGAFYLDEISVSEIVSIKDTYDSVFGKMGTCINPDQLKDQEVLSYVKKNYSSITMENDMKPDYLLASWLPLIDTETAAAKTTDYVIPDTYTETQIPTINYGTVDSILKIAKENGLKLRYHVLLWHAQTPEWFFKVDYSKEDAAAYVSPEVMYARLEMYIRSVIHHVYTVENGAYKDVVYAWDVANEYFSNTANKNWSAVFGNREGNLENKPPFIKKAFEIAHDELGKYDLADSVSLFYNDFNTYMTTDKIVEMIHYINSDEKVCDGIGMQSHLGVDFPSVDGYVNTVKRFLEEGFEVQITELDVGCNKELLESDVTAAYEQQAAYVKELTEKLINVQKTSDFGITGMTWWGMYDARSWRGDSHVLMFDTSLYDAKPSYFAFIEAAGELQKPVATPTPIPTATPVATATLEPTPKYTMPAETAAPVAEYDFTNENNYRNESPDGATSVVNEDGSISITFSRQYAAFDFFLPDTAQNYFSNYKSVELTYTSEGGNLGHALYDINMEGMEGDPSAGKHADWNQKVVESSQKKTLLFPVTKDCEGGCIRGLQIFNPNSLEEGNTISIRIYSLKFYDVEDPSNPNPTSAPTATVSPTATQEATATPTGSSQETAKPTATATPTGTASSTETAKPTATVSPTATPDYTSIDVDLSDVASKVNQSGVTYDEQTGILNVQDVGSFSYPLEVKVAPEEKISVTIQGELKGEKGFRCYLTPAGDKAVSNIANSEEANKSGSFEWTFDLTNTSTEDATHLMIKGRDYQTTIDNLDIKQIRIAYKSDTLPTATPMPTATPTPAPTATPKPAAETRSIALTEDNLMFSGGVSEVVYNEDGSVDVKVNGAWGKVVFYLDTSKSAIALTNYSKAAIEMSGDSQFCVGVNMTKTNDVNGKSVGPGYYNVGDTITSVSYDITPYQDQSACAILLQYNSDTAPSPDFTMHIKSITLVEDTRDITAATSQYTSLYTLAEKYGFKMGTVMNPSKISDKKYSSLMKHHFNSITASNEMKAYSMLDESKSRENYSDSSSMPVINFTNADIFMDYAKKEGIAVRGHTLVWDADMCDWFFREGYTRDGQYVSADVVKARVKSYIEQVLTHFEEKYPGVIYCWDVVNEAVEPGKRLDSSDERGIEDNIFSQKMGSDYVELSFQYTRECLESLGVADRVKLYYNDFNTFYKDKRDAICKLVDSINKYKSDGNGGYVKLCDGVGMQSYIGGFGQQAGCMNDNDITSVKNAIEAFASHGVDVQVTELAVRNYENTEEVFAKHAAFYKKLFETYISINQNNESKPLKAIAIWGIVDIPDLAPDDYSFKMNGPYCGLFDETLHAKGAFENIYKLMGGEVIAVADPTFAPSTQNYEFFNAYTLGWSDGIVAYQDGVKKSLEEVGAAVYNAKESDAFVQHIDNKWYADKITLTQPIQYTTADGKAHNVDSMLTNYDFMADPTAIDNSDKDGKLYVYGTTEGFSYDSGTISQNVFDNHSLTILSTSDMVNWTDEGRMDNQNLTNQVSTSQSKVACKWATKAWAPSGLKIDGDGDGDDEYYLFYTNGGAVGYVMGDSPTGPWKDPLGKTLFTQSTPNCSSVIWCFDPAVLVDDKGDAYVYFGGGVPDDDKAHGKTARVCKIKFAEGTGEVKLDGDPQELDNYYMFEDSEINQFHGKYYYSYCTNFNVPYGDKWIGSGQIACYVSSDPMNISFAPEGENGDKYTDDQGIYHHYLGSILNNPSSIYGESYNNHHHMQSFKGHDYIFYHSTILGNTLYRDNKQYRNLHVDEISVDADSDEITINPSYEGASQIENFNPYTKQDGSKKYINATTSASSAGVKASADDIQVKSSLNGSPMVLDAIDTGDWSCIKSVDFGENGVKNFGVELASGTTTGRIELFVDSPVKLDNKIASIDISENTDNNYVFKNAAISKSITGVHDIYFVFRGDHYKVASWFFSENEELEEPEVTNRPVPTKLEVNYGWNEDKTQYRLELNEVNVNAEGGASVEFNEYSATATLSYNGKYPGVWFTLPSSVSEKFDSITITYKDGSTGGCGRATRYEGDTNDQEIAWGGCLPDDGTSETVSLDSTKVLRKFKYFRNDATEGCNVTIVSVVLKKAEATPTPTATAESTANIEATATPDISVPSNFNTEVESNQGTVETITYDSTVVAEGKTVQRKAKVVLPKGYTEDKKYPVVYMQHGIFGNEESLYGDGTQNVFWNAMANGDVTDLIAVFPNACANETGSGEGYNLEHYAAYDNFINDLTECLMPYVNEHYSTLTGRENTAICGFSMGGRVSLQIGFQKQDMFGYVGGFCPAFGIFEYTNYGVTESGFFTEDSFTLEEKYKDSTVVVLAAGASDDIVKTEPKRYSDALTKNGDPHLYYETEGGHEKKVYQHGLYNFLKRIFKEWNTTWGTAEEKCDITESAMPKMTLEGSTVRQIIKVTSSGTKMRLKLSNQYGGSDVNINSLHLAKQVEADKSQIDTATDTVVTVGGKSKFSIPKGETIVTDPIEFKVKALENVAISTYFGTTPTTNITGHRGARATTYQVSGNKVSEEVFSNPETTTSWFFLADASILSEKGSRAVVCFGDSITDGYGTDASYLGKKPDSYTRWGDYFAKRLQGNEKTKNVSVINEGIGSNSILGSYPTDAGKDRFARDLLEHDGVAYCIILFGVNDLNALSDTSKFTSMKAEYEKMIQLCHDNNIKVYAAPILPFGTSSYYSESSEEVRTMINNWFRSSDSKVDGIIDFESAVADPDNPKNILEAYTHKDGLHPYDGYSVMADAVDLKLFE